MSFELTSYFPWLVAVFVITITVLHFYLFPPLQLQKEKQKIENSRFSVLFYFIYVILSLFSLNYLTHELTRAQKEKLMGYAPSYALTFERMDYELISEKTPNDDSLYLKLINLEIDWQKSNPYVTDIYTMSLNDENKPVLIVDSETDYNHDEKFEGDREQRTKIGELYEKDLPELSAALHGEASFTETPYSDKWGDWVSAFVPIKNKNGSIIGILGVDFDANQFFSEISKTVFAGIIFFLVLYIGIARVWSQHLESQQKNKELENALIAAERAKEAKTQFISHMSHEIRTPLNGIVSISSLLAEGGIPLDEIPESIQILRSCSDQLLELVNDILDYSKIESRKMIVEHTVFNLFQTVEDAANVLKQKFIEKNLKLLKTIDIEPQQEFRGDPVKIKQVLVNFLSNAAKFTDSGTIELRVEKVQNSEVLKYRFSVKDSGVGISKDKISKLFNEYEQIEASTTRKFGGTGLGLWICKGLIEAMNGTIEVTSELGHGSTFSFEIPAHPIAAKALPSKPQAIWSAKSHIKVLVVDDNQVNRVVLGKFLTKLGYPFSEATNGIEAVQQYNNHHFDLIFMDCNMPLMDGYEASRQIKKIAAEKPGVQTIIAAVTASVSTEDRANCSAAGMDGFISKPIRITEIEQLIAKHFSRDLEIKNKEAV